MVSNQIIQKSMTELKNITGVEFCVLDTTGQYIYGDQDLYSVDMDVIREFVNSEADSQAIGNVRFLKTGNEDEGMYIVITLDDEASYTIGKIAVSQLKQLNDAYQDKMDKNSFYQNLILDNMLLVDIHNKAKRLHLECSKKRVVFLVEVDGSDTTTDNMALELLKGMYSGLSGDHVTTVDEKNIILIKMLAEESGAEQCEMVANTIVDMMNTEIMQNVHVSYGNIVSEMKDVSKSYKEAKMALDVGKIFYSDKNIVSYATLGIGRLIYQLPVNLCKMFIHEIFGEKIPEELDEETLSTLEKFFDNNLNVSETSRQLFLHRNTLVYRIEKLQKVTGLDVRNFDDAMTLKIALMVVNYIEYLEKLD
mgnify:CR=1 FL=1